MQNFEVEQNSVATENIMSRHWLIFVATLVIPVATKKKIKPHLSGKNFCRYKVGAKMGYTRKSLSQHNFFMS